MREVPLHAHVVRCGSLRGRVLLFLPDYVVNAFMRVSPLWDFWCYIVWGDGQKVAYHGDQVTTTPTCAIIVSMAQEPEVTLEYVFSDDAREKRRRYRLYAQSVVSRLDAKKSAQKQSKKNSF